MKLFDDYSLYESIDDFRNYSLLYSPDIDVEACVLSEAWF